MKSKNGNSKNITFKNEKVMETQTNESELRHYHWFTETPGFQRFFLQRQFVNLLLKTAIIFAFLAALSVFKSNAANYYWVGGTGNWSNFANHWATSSGGTTFHASSPSPVDNVYFDANSFPSPNDTVHVDVSIAYANNMDWTGATNNPVLSDAFNSFDLNLYGSLILESGMRIAFQNFLQHNINFLGSGTFIVDTKGVYMEWFYVTFNNTTGNWRIVDDFNDFMSWVTINAGSVTLNGYDFNCENLFIYSAQQVVLSTSRIFCVQSMEINSGTQVSADSAFIEVPGYFICRATNVHFKKIVSNSIELDLCMIDFAECGILGGVGNVVKDLRCGAIYLYSGFSPSSLPNHFIKVFLAGSVINGGSFPPNNLIIDTLYIPSSVIDFALEIDTLFILKELIINKPNGQLNLHSSSTVQIIDSTGIVCLNNTVLTNIHASGGAQFFAGSGCINVGGNSGWTWAPCSIVSNVWPGDANYDLIVNNQDVLNIGLAYNETGPLRSGASLAYVAQPATDWNGYFQSAVNHKHADTNGDGVVNANDTTAISLNYGLSHPARLAGNAQQTSFPLPQLYILASDDSVAEGDTVEFEIYLGDASNPVNNIYGLAFTIDIDTSFIDTVYAGFDFTGSWLGTQGVDLLTYSHPVWSQNKIDVALTRTTQTDTSGFGYLGRFGVVIVDNVGARLSSPSNYVTMPVSVSNVYAIDYTENILSISTLGDSVVIDTVGAVGINNFENLSESILVYPNPAKDAINIKSGKAEIISIEMLSTLGAVVKTRQVQNNVVHLDLSDLTSGIYVLRLVTDKGVINKKVHLIKRKK